jgi:signal transduction histidine kinase
MRHPIRLLLYIEWILFAGLMVLEVSPHSTRSDRPIWLNIGTIVLIAVMGLRLPSGRLSIKAIYTIAEIIPIILASLNGMRWSWLLYIIVAIRSYLIFARQYRLWITIGISTLFLAVTIYQTQYHRSTDRFSSSTTSAIVQPTDRPVRKRTFDRAEYREYRWAFVFMFAGILLSLQLLIDRMLAEQKAKEELSIANQRIRNYAIKAEEIGSLQERNRIAREIHDSLGHSLTTLNLYLEMAVKFAHIQPERSHEVLIEAKRLGSIALQDVRQSVSTLRSDPLQGKDLPIALHRLVEEFQQSSQIESRCDLDLPLLIPSEVAITIYRIVQEGLTNITKYAQANKASIKVKTTATEIELRIIDDGCGFNTTYNSSGFGLQGMRERVTSLQGKFEIVSSPGQGCQIMAIIPLD